MDRDRNQHSDPSGTPVDPRGPMLTQDVIRDSLLIVLEGIGDVPCSKNSKYNLKWHMRSIMSHSVSVLSKCLSDIKINK